MAIYCWKTEPSWLCVARHHPQVSHQASTVMERSGIIISTIKSMAGWCLPTTSDASLEVRSQRASHVVQSELEPDLLHCYSDLTWLLCITAWIRRLITRLRRLKTGETSSYLILQELHATLFHWVSISQRTSFSHDLQLLSRKQTVANSSSLHNVTPFIAQDGFLRVGRRLDKSSLDYDTKHILSKHSNLTRLVIRDAHLWRLHSGTRNTLAIVHQRFWILGGRPTVRKEILYFVICARYRWKSSTTNGSASNNSSDSISSILPFRYWLRRTF